MNNLVDSVYNLSAALKVFDYGKQKIISSWMEKLENAAACKIGGFRSAKQKRFVCIDEAFGAGNGT